MNQKYLQFIGKGQLTIPQVWRSLLHLDTKLIKATLSGNKIILEPMVDDFEKDWEMENISFDSLPRSDTKLITEGRRDYRKKKKEKFMTSIEFFKEDNV
ncbi:hypothetical protein HYV57_01895 [Candidatus Peregrinibacteria bacterium]|nr:hypothetical protein [Candidatus Peregrinibacteria bacterium]